MTRAGPAFPKVRVVTVSECASHVVADVAMGAVAGKGAGEQSLARKLYRRLDERLAPYRRPELLQLGGLVHGRGHGRAAAVAGQGRPHPAGPGVAAGWVLFLGAGEPEGPR